MMTIKIVSGSNPPLNADYARIKEEIKNPLSRPNILGA